MFSLSWRRWISLEPRGRLQPPPPVLTILEVWIFTARLAGIPSRYKIVLTVQEIWIFTARIPGIQSRYKIVLTVQEVWIFTARLAGIPSRYLIVKTKKWYRKVN